MAAIEPVTRLDAGFSSNGATATEWAVASGRLAEAGVCWLSTVRPDGRPHVTPLIAVWLDGAVYFCTGPEERKAKNLVANPHVILTAGCNQLREGLDVVVEGDAKRVRDDDVLRRVAAAYEKKSGSDWHFDVRDGVFVQGSIVAWVYEVAPATAFAFGKGDPYSQTRYRFPATTSPGGGS